MRPITSIGLSAIAVAASLFLTACGGGSSSSVGGTVDTTGSGTNTSGSNSNGSSSGSGFTDSFGNPVTSSDGFSAGDYGVNGSAGDGLPIVGGSVVIIDSHGTSTPPVTTNASGYYRVKVNGLVPPLIAKVTKLDGSVRYSVTDAPLVQNGFVVVNITSLTSQVAYDVAGAANLTSPANLPNAFPATTSSQIVASVDRLKVALAKVIVAAGLNAATFDPIKVAFVPNSTGYDFVLDNSVTPAAPSVNATQPSAYFVPTDATRAQNLALAQTEVQNFFTTFNGLFATAAPSALTVQNYLNSAFFMDGKNQATQANSMASGVPVGVKFGFAGVAPYSGAPLTGPTPATAVTYDGNGCVTSMWVNMTENGVFGGSMEMRATIPAGNPAGTCTNGTWTMAGNQRQYHSNLLAQNLRLDNGTSLFYRTGMLIDTNSSQGTLYTRVDISGPGIATSGNRTATTGTVSVVPNAPALNDMNTINDPYYGSGSSNAYGLGLEGSSGLEDCASASFGQSAWQTNSLTSATPCLNVASVSPGSDYTIQVYNGTTLLETHMDRLYVKPVASLPATLYATVNSVSTSPAPLTSAGGTVSLAWTMPSGVMPFAVKLNINDTPGTTLRNISKNLSATATSTSILANGFPAGINGSNNGIPAVGGSYAMVLYSVGGMIVASAKAF